MGSDGDELASHLHITPCRASRALALRFLALKGEQSMADMTVVSLPARISRQAEDRLRVTGHTNDLSELISGLCKVFCLGAAQAVLRLQTSQPARLAHSGHNLATAGEASLCLQPEGPCTGQGPRVKLEPCKHQA